MVPIKGGKRMTQKDEKRIFIREVENPCADCENKGCNVCKCGEIWKASIPRDEAVERMAKVLYEEMFKGIVAWEKIEEKSRWRIYAEAALNALLGDKNA